ncbi:replication protein A 70 kDa DNA-binding subunit E-like [Brassica rapa]|uniref:replication protein A 70 kDa DNA-binding subunit E-like n=1 Tax=Brassica campestris TaxID=3711 RepID=UPI00142D22E8|nr:replication protein A 70 kDa DNA-binding subunit E-like [Brassica rapa]
MDRYRFLRPRFYIDLLICVFFFGSRTVLSFQLLPAMKVSGVSDSEKMTGETAIPSDSVNPISQSGVSSGDNGPTKSRCGMADSKGTSKSGPQSGITSGVDKPVKSRGTTAETQRPIRTHGRTGGSSGPVIGVRGRPSVSAIDKGKSIVSDDVGKVITFKDVKFGPHEDEIRFRLIHFWEAWNVQTKVLIGIEMLLIDEEASVIQGFISYGRIETYLPHMKAGCTYRLNKFYGSKSKTVYRIADSDVTISFSWNSALTALEDSSICFPEDRIRIHGFREFDGASDLKGDLYDYIGHIKLVNGKVPTDSILLDEGEIAVSRRVELHVQTHDDPVMKLYLWDKAAFEFIDKFKASRGTARVILVTTLNPKRFGGVLSLSAMASSRVFMDSDIQETLSYLSWLNSNLDVASRVNAEVITKPEPATLGELFAYMNQASSKVAWFECTATIDDVVHGSGWYYIGCGVCHTKATKGPTTLMCKKCGKSEIVGVAQYLTRLSVYDNNDQAVFVVLGDAGEELTGKKASELVEKYYQVNDNIEGDHKVPVPQAMIDTIGQTRKFIVKVSKHNLDAKTQTLTVTKVLPPDAAGPEDNLEGDVDVIGDAEGVGNAAEFGKRGADEIESEGVKRAKCG